MIAHLQEGRYGDARILEEDTAQEMHRQHFANDPRLPGFAYGFMEHLQNDRRALWHTGTSTTHHSTACSFCCPTMTWACSCPSTFWTAGCRTT